VCALQKGGNQQNGQLSRSVELVQHTHGRDRGARTLPLLMFPLNRFDSSAAGQAADRIRACAHTRALQLSRSLAIAGVPSGATQFVPISAARGTNIVRRDPRTEFPWYDGPTLLSALRRTVDSVSSINSLRWRWNLVRARHHLTTTQPPREL
jgi:translation elongation factor EF-1alpha